MEDTNKKKDDLYDRNNPNFIGVNRVNTYTADIPDKLRDKYTAPDQTLRIAKVANPNNSWV